MELKLSDKGLQLIKQFEGCRLKAYKCVSTEKYYTIGYGHYGSDVKKDMTITLEQAEEYLKKDVQSAIKHVNTYMAKYNFNQNQFDALVSFAFNVGNIKQLTQNGARTIVQISEAIPLYCKSGGNTLTGLIRRRKAEQELFNTPTVDIPKTEIYIALEVIDGKWGNGDERKTRIVEAGYDYANIQSLVNTIIKWCKERGYM